MLLSASSALEWERISFEAISHQPSHRQCASSARRRLRWVLCIPRTRKSGGQFVGKRILRVDDGRGGAGVGGVGELVLVGSSLRTDWCGFRICAGFYIKCFKLVTNRISKSCSRESNLDYLWAANISLGIYATSTTFHRKLYKLFVFLVHILLTWQQRSDKTTCWISLRRQNYLGCCSRKFYLVFFWISLRHHTYLGFLQSLHTGELPATAQYIQTDKQMQCLADVDISERCFQSSFSPLLSWIAGPVCPKLLVKGRYIHFVDEHWDCQKYLIFFAKGFLRRNWRSLR